MFGRLPRWLPARHRDRRIADNEGGSAAEGSYGAAVSKQSLVAFAVCVLAVALVASACSGSEQESELTVDAYAARLLEIMEAPVPEDDFPVGGSNVRVAGTFAVVENGLNEMRSMQPPPELEDTHAELLVLFDAVQEAVASYLQHHGTDVDDIEIAHIANDPDIRPVLREAWDACSELIRLLGELGAVIPAGTCLV